MFSILLALLAGQDPAATADPPTVELRQRLEARSEAGVAAGHTGSVRVEITVQPDGSKGPATIVESSRSDILDAEAVRLIETAGFRAPAQATRYRAKVEFSAADDALTCAGMARQVRWFQQAWPERPLKEAEIFNISRGLLLVAGLPETPNREVARAQGRQWVRFEAEFLQIVEACEREPDRPYFPVLGEWARRG